MRWFTVRSWGSQESTSRACRKRPFHCDPCLPKPLLATPYIDSAMTKEKGSLPARDLATDNSSLTEETPCWDGNLRNTGTERNKPTKLLLPKCPRQTTSAGPSLLLCHHSPPRPPRTLSYHAELYGFSGRRLKRRCKMPATYRGG